MATSHMLVFLDSSACMASTACFAGIRPNLDLRVCGPFQRCLMLPSVLLVLDVLGVLLKLLKSIEPGALPQWKLGKCAYWGE